MLKGKDKTMELLQGDNMQHLREMADNSVGACVTDPPYGLKFMSKKWDHSVPTVELWREVYRVLKPGAHLLSFFSTRTYHRGVVAIEDAGFEIRDQIGWLYGSGFPKSLDVSKAIDKAAGAEREVVGPGRWNSVKGEKGRDGGITPDGYVSHGGTAHSATAPATDAAKQWDGWGTALKPAWEPIVVARKPLIGTVAQNVLEHGVGGINVDGCRVGTSKDVPVSPSTIRTVEKGIYGKFGLPDKSMSAHNPNIGRWPANVIHDGSDEVLAEFAKYGESKPKPGRTGRIGGLGGEVFGNGNTGFSPEGTGTWPADNGGTAARFFYCAKTSKRERGDGNKHPTVKPIALMEYLIKLVTPPGGTVLDPFAGSGSTLIAAERLGFDSIGIELEAEYVDIIRARLDAYWAAMLE